MWRELNSQLKQEMARAISARFGVEHDPVLEVPPRRELGDLAFPAALQLARTLKKNPRAIADELRAEFRLPEGVREIQILGAGYLNLFLDRPVFVGRLLGAPILSGTSRSDKVVVEHTNINPNKAAHIGHLRNAVLGDVLGRSLRALGFPTEVQNYIDDTGVQVADVVVGFLDLRGITLAEVAALPEPFDFYCWDLYSEVGRWFGDDPERQALRRATLHELESGKGPRAEMARLVARRIVGRHLATMARLGIGYDLLTHESDILALHFFDVAFERLKVSGAVRLEADGKNAGCWVMPLSESDEFAGLEDPDKVIVRSDGTVTYVGKDIAYQLWKFGLLGKDFEYRLWTEQNLWQTCHKDGAAEHPTFGGASRVINVIDNRQSYLQKIVRAGLQSLGHGEEAKRSVHFAYEMVALSPATARLLGFAVEGEEKALEMSGRKGIGVKADDLIDQLQAKSREEIAARNRELDPATLDTLAHQIAVAAIRFFMVKATTNRVIAFDFDEALSFEGESGPYLQYSLVRAKNIRRKLVEAGLAAEVAPETAAGIPAEAYADDLWDLVLATAQVEEAIERGALGLELSIVARQALDLAQKFNQAYHKHPILHEQDETLRTARLAAVQVYQKGLETLADVLGVPVPDKM
ncbi:MAG TPA: arginine--tRNA ligase [Thermoanaerobaculia bacterium]|jgi:arginyl-tRNA synthetase|nr:arginine--tRNA ligase [Thermoanaerobaculia bacterium]